AQDSLQGQAEEIAKKLGNGLPVALLDDDEKNLAQVTPEQIQQVATTYFTHERMAVAYSQAKEANDELADPNTCICVFARRWRCRPRAGTTRNPRAGITENTSPGARQITAADRILANTARQQGVVQPKPAAANVRSTGCVRRRQWT
ncbi:MAG: hypothetical protein ACRESP_17425, partial [Pseudomonas sp.]